MNGSTIRTISTLALFLAGFMSPSYISAQQAPQQQAPAAQSQSGNSANSAEGSQSQSNSGQTPSQTEQLQQQEDKASQDLINGTPANSKSLPESPDVIQSREAAQTPITPVPAPPLGTAAAQELRPSGVLASRPAGAAIAPPRQRQVRSFLLKVGAVAAAGVVLGTVVALTHASGSTPPGAR